MDNANERDYRGWLEFTADALECLTCLPVPVLMERLAESFEGQVSFNEGPTRRRRPGPGGRWAGSRCDEASRARA